MATYTLVLHVMLNVCHVLACQGICNLQGHVVSITVEKVVMLAQASLRP